MFSRSFNKSHTDNFSKHRRGTNSKSSFREHAVSKHRHERNRRPEPNEPTQTLASTLSSSIITVVVGRDQRLFAAHEDVLCVSPYFRAACREQFMNVANKRIALPDEEPEIFSSVLEYLYKGDYTPRLVHDEKRNLWELERAITGAAGATIFHGGFEGEMLKDTVMYCTAEKYGLDELKHVALRKQGLQSGIQCSTILTSARYAYANTPDSDSKLRAHYLALIIRSRSTFKRSGTMQLEMHAGGTPLFFDLFVALCNHVDDVSSVAGSPRSLRTR